MEGHEREKREEATAALTGGRLLTAICNRIVALRRENYGRGPMQAKAYAHDDLIVVVLRGMGLTPLEKTMMENGDPGRVVDMRRDFQRVMSDRYKETIEELTGRTVVAFLSQAHVEPDITLETFFLDRPLEPSAPSRSRDPDSQRPSAAMTRPR